MTVHRIADMHWVARVSGISTDDESSQLAICKVYMESFGHVCLRCCCSSDTGLIRCKISAKWAARPCWPSRTCIELNIYKLVQCFWKGDEFASRFVLDIWHHLFEWYRIIRVYMNPYIFGSVAQYYKQSFGGSLSVRITVYSSRCPCLSIYYTNLWYSPKFWGNMWKLIHWCEPNPMPGLFSLSAFSSHVSKQCNGMLPHVHENKYIYIQLHSDAAQWSMRDA